MESSGSSINDEKYEVEECIIKIIRAQTWDRLITTEKISFTV